MQSVYAGIGWHSIVQLPTDPDHVGSYAFMKQTLALCMQTVTGKRKLHLRAELDRRLMAFEFPYGWQRFTFHMLRTVGSNHSMELFRRASTVCIHIFQGMHVCVVFVSGHYPGCPDGYPGLFYNYRFSFSFFFFFFLL